MFERYDEPARRAIFFARYEASQNGATAIGSLHLLLGLLRESGTLFTLTGSGVSVNAIIEDCRKALPTLGEKTSTSVDMPLTEECKNALAEAAMQAENQGIRTITPRHLTLGLLAVSNDVAAILSKHGVTAEKLGAVKDTHAEAAASTHAPGIVLEFVCRGEQIASIPVEFSAMPPRVGDEVAFTHEAKTETFKVLNVRHCFEGSALSGLIRGRLTKLVIEVEDITPATP